MKKFNILDHLREIDLQRNKDAVDYSSIIENVSNNPVIIYGYGTIGQGIAKCLDGLEANIIGVCDNNKIGIMTDYGTIKPIHELLQYNPDSYIIVCSRISFYEIKDDLKQFVAVDKIIDGDHLYHNFINYFALLEDFKSNPFYIRKEIYKKLLIDHLGDINNLCSQLADTKSIETVVALFKHIYTGNMDYIDDVYDPVQYFTRDVIEMSDNEVFVDGGAFDGDTINEFIKISGNKFEKIYCFEPIKEQYERLYHNIKIMGEEKRIHAFQYGLSDTNDILHFSVNGTASRIIDVDSETNDFATDSINVVALDNVICDKVTFIKMDIEGAELSALRGAEALIRKYKPKLAICIYHKPEDIVTIPNYIMSLGLDYKYYIRQHFRGYTETVFYAI
jgi:FkbM family methyltransferase